MLLGTIGIFIAMFCFAIIVETPKKHLLLAASVGTFSGFIYLLGMHFSLGAVTSSFLSALTAALVSHICARLFKAPVTLFLFVGILPTVPGGGMYRIAAGVLDNDSVKVFNSLIEVLEIAGVIALAIFIMDVLFRTKRWERGKVMSK